MIEIDSKSVERVSLILSGVQNGPQRVFHSVINRALAVVKTTATKRIRTVYSISQSDIRAESNIRLKMSSAGNLAGEVLFAGCKIPLYRFNVSPKEPGTGKKVRAAVLKSSTQTEFERAFIGGMGNGHKGMFERKRETRLPIRELYGPSVAHMAENSVVVEEIEKAAQETINKRVEQEITRILNGIGG